MDNRSRLTAAQDLMGMSWGELMVICMMLHIKTQRDWDRSDVMNAILDQTNPITPLAAPSEAAPVTEYTQPVMF